jgi:putative membrane protein
MCGSVKAGRDGSLREVEREEMKTNRTTGIALFVLLAWGAAFAQMHGAGGQATQQMGPNQEPKNEMVNGPEADKTFLKKAMESHLGEIQMAQLALQKSSDDKIKQFAQQVLDDHGKILDELRQAALQLNVPVPTEPSKGVAKSLEKLKTLSGPAFDQAYVKETMKAHKDEDKAFKEEARNTTSPQLKEMMTADAQMIEGHLQQLQRLSDSAGKAKS